MDLTKDPCPVAKTAALLADVYTMLILREVLDGPRRFCELERTLTGISTRTLSAKLRKLENDKILAKRTAGDYATTKKGTALKSVLKAMRKYGHLYL